MTEIVQIIGRATRDAVGKTKARFTNLIAEPDAGEQAVTEAVNDTLKAIAASLLMEQVLAPRFEFRPKTPTNLPGGPLPGLDYGADGYDPGGCNVGMDPSTGGVQIEINGLVEPESDEATRICREDLNEVLASFVQDTRTVQIACSTMSFPLRKQHNSEWARSFATSTPICLSKTKRPFGSVPSQLLT